MSKRILVVEDQADTRQIIRDMLAPTDYEIIEAKNGEQALAAIAKQRPDLILMDIQLPIMDGYTATRQIKSDPALRSIPIAGRFFRTEPCGSSNRPKDSMRVNRVPLRRLLVATTRASDILWRTPSASEKPAARLNATWLSMTSSGCPVASSKLDPATIAAATVAIRPSLLMPRRMDYPVPCDQFDLKTFQHR